MRAKVLTEAELAARLSRQRQADKDRAALRKMRHAVSKFRPRKKDFGKIVMIGVKGARDADKRGRRGFAVYVNTKGRKIPVRQRSRATGKLEKAPHARKLSSVDITRVRSKRAKRDFLQTKMNPVAAGIFRTHKGTRHLKPGEKGDLPSRATRYAGRLDAKRVDIASRAVTLLSRELVKAVRGTRSKRDFLVTIGIACKTRGGERFWIETQQRFSRMDGQPVTLAECRGFFGFTIYGFLARALGERGLVMGGSARHVARLSENEGIERGDWRQDGFLWKGNSREDVSVSAVEYRIDQLTLTK